jgi:hypothetical protein
MAKPAYVILNVADGKLIITYSPDIGGTGYPTNYPSDLENLIAFGYVAKREINLDGTGKVLIVLEKP